ncbi:MAG: phosphoenolpyruvate carboxykinase (ATP) [Candidatus Marinimicrobia bacterium]|nr:phosphoenolpyruvate carboxykinase (ATP) [Candidatus Neomarinimicrobiota bacterium]
MKRQVREELTKSQYAGTLASEHGLENHGLKYLNEVFWNLSTSELYEEILDREEGKIAHNGPLLVYTGEHTARAANDKYVVKEPSTDGDIWWGKHNKPYTVKKFANLSNRLKGYLQGKDVFVQDCYVGADAEYQMPIRVITQKAWHSLFARNMFVVERDDQKLLAHVPEFTLISAPDFKADPEYDDLNSETFIIINFAERLAIIGGSLYGGEIKKSFFTIMNYLLPKRNVLTMHCSANIGSQGDVAIFFGLSGTGKTTLSADVNRGLIGDDEHGWSEKGVFNFEGGCYAKVINLNAEAEPQIYACTKMFGTILENVVFETRFRHLDLDDDMYTENTRASYPLDFISNAIPEAKGDHPKNIFMLTCDVSGVLPPISRLNADQAMYHFISGYTSKVGGTEIGLGADPVSTFSACFGAPFMVHHPYVYAQLLKEKMLKHNVTCWLINTGWTGGPFGIGKRISIQHTRALLNAALEGELATAEFRIDSVFGFEIPKTCPGVPSELLNPITTWIDKDDYQRRLQNLARKFVENFEQFHDGVTPQVIAAGPNLSSPGQ